MATTFPTALDAFTNPTTTDTLGSVTVPHATQHADANDAIEALQAKVGIDSSAVPTSLDYRVTALEAGGGGSEYLVENYNGAVPTLSSGVDQLALGENVTVAGNYSIGIGETVRVDGRACIAMGSGVNAKAVDPDGGAIAVGNDAYGHRATSIGFNASVGTDLAHVSYSTAINMADVQANNAIGIGNGITPSSVTHDNAVVIGFADSSAANQIVLADGAGNVLIRAKASDPRQIAVGFSVVSANYGLCIAASSSQSEVTHAGAVVLGGGSSTEANEVKIADGLASLKVRFDGDGNMVFGAVPREAADDAAAALLSPAVPVGGVYRTGSVLKVRVA